MCEVDPKVVRLDANLKRELQNVRTPDSPPALVASSPNKFFQQPSVRFPSNSTNRSLSNITPNPSLVCSRTPSIDHRRVRGRACARVIFVSSVSEKNHHNLGVGCGCGCGRRRRRW